MITIDPTGPVPAFEQIRVQLTDLIRSGRLGAGQRLPSIRQLAGDLRLAPGTVARAYSELESTGLIETSRSTGTRVRPGQVTEGELHVTARRFVASVQRSGVTLPEALGAVRAAWEAR